VGYKFSLVLSREITDEESAILKEAGCAEAVFGTDSLPTNADVTVAMMDFDDNTSPSLEKAIQSALDAVKSVPDLSVPGLTVPAQPAGPAAEESPGVVQGEVVKDEVVEDAVSAVSAAADGNAAEEASNGQAAATKAAPSKAAVKKASNGRTTTRKTSARKPANGNGAAADDAMDPAGAAAGPA
jgi:hypothetical protein